MFLFYVNYWTNTEVFLSYQETRLHRKKLFNKAWRGEDREGKTKKKTGAGHERLVGEQDRGSRETNDGQPSGPWAVGHPGSKSATSLRVTVDKDEDGLYHIASGLYHS